MDSNEEYLDQLLRSLTEGSSGIAGDADGLDQDDGLEDLLNQFSDDMDNVPEDLFSGLLGDSDNLSSEPLDAIDESMLSDILQDVSAENGLQERNLTAEGGPLESKKTENFSEEMQAAAPVEDSALQESGLEETELTSLEMPETDDFGVGENSASGTESASVDDMDDDLGSLLESLGADGDQDAQEISELLDKADRDEPISDVVDSLMKGLNEEVFPEVGYTGDDFLGEDAIDALLGSRETEEKTEKKKEKKKKEKEKKKPRRSKKKKELEEIAADLTTDDEESLQDMGDTAPEESSEGEKKQGFWGRLLNVLTQEEEEEEDPSDLVSDENGEILKQLDKEKKQPKGKKNKKEKDKKGKDKKGKDKKAAEVGEDEDFDDAAESKQKKKKEKKPKKEKQPVPAEESVPDRKLSLKKILPLVAVFLVLCLAFVMVSHLYINHVNKQEAEDAYYAENYLECYSLFFGQDLNESQEVMFHRSELVLQMERMKGNYRRLVMEGKELEALDYLVQCICRREDCYLRGQEWNSLGVVEEAYAGMMGLLTANYGLTEERAKEIAALEKDEDYTIALMQVLEKISSGDADGEDQPVPYEDLLPEEQEDTASSFVDTLGD